MCLMLLQYKNSSCLKILANITLIYHCHAFMTANSFKQDDTNNCLSLENTDPANRVHYDKNSTGDKCR